MHDLHLAWYGAILGLFIAIFLILKKINPVYALFFGAIIGAVFGGANLEQTISVLISGTQSIMGTVIRVLAAGILAGVMMESGAANTIAREIVRRMGEGKAIFALALATMVITAVGVFIPVAVLIVAPIALSVGNRMGLSKTALLLALSGGGKAGNIISPNPNTIAAANGFHLGLSDVMIAGFIPAIGGLLVTVLIASLIKHKGQLVSAEEADNENNGQLAGPFEELRQLQALLTQPGENNLIAIISLTELAVLRPALNKYGRWDENEHLQQFKAMLALMNHRSHLRVRFALGNYFPGANGVARSWQTAHSTMMIGKRRRPEQRCYSYRDLKLPVLLQRLQGGWQETELLLPITKLKLMDKNGQLQRTLKIWFEHNNQAGIAAAALFVHRHTLDYRLNRIADITGLNLADFDDRLALYIALQLDEESLSQRPRP